MRMARVNVYLSDDLADAARRAGLNVSGLTQEAIRAALVSRRTNAWLEAVAALPAADVDPGVVRAAVVGAKEDFERNRG